MKRDRIKRMERQVRKLNLAPVQFVVQIDDDTIMLPSGELVDAKAYEAEYEREHGEPMRSFTLDMGEAAE